jgi:hypothetical protein
VFADVVACVLYLDRPRYAWNLERAQTLTLAEDERIRSVAARSARSHGGWFSHGYGDCTVLVMPNRHAATACWDEIRWSLPGIALKAGCATGLVQQDEQGRACGAVVARAAGLVEDVDPPVPAGVLQEWTS